MPQGSRCWHRLKPQIVVYLGLLRGNHTTENCLPSPRQLEKSLLARHWPRVPSRSRLPPVLLAVLASPWLASFVHSPGGRRPLPPQEMARGLQGSAGLELWHVLPIQAAPQVNFPSVHGQLCGLGCASSVFVCLSCFFYP